MSNVKLWHIILFTSIIYLITFIYWILLNYSTIEIVSTYWFMSIFIEFILIMSFQNHFNKRLEDLGLQSHTFILDLILGIVLGSILVIIHYIATALLGGTVNSFMMRGDLLFSLGFMAFITAFLEELIFRGVIAGYLADLFDVKMGIIISSILFGLIHFSWWLPLGSVPLIPTIIFIVNMFLGGVLLSIMYFKSGRNLFYPIGLHMAWNTLGYALFPHYPRESVISPELFQFEWSILTTVVFIIGIIIIYLFEQMKNKKHKLLNT